MNTMFGRGSLHRSIGHLLGQVYIGELVLVHTLLTQHPRTVISHGGTTSTHHVYLSVPKFGENRKSKNVLVETSS